ncbi:MAG: HAMP domain-containing histidine kinase [Candidatus Hydrogenedens sp.]|nr:HAMP domain-containing histidine kinase [Candidatus Hydrogenedentota bacterium]NLF56922.1 HAMP domain-containing histidine kinase [Candidatus Hydrogenedens sp.]
MSLRHTDFSQPEGAECLWNLCRQALAGRCVSGVSHDLNNHLGAVLAFAELLLLEGDLSPEARELVESQIEAVSRGIRLVANLTKVARPRRAQNDMTDLRAVTENALALREYAQRSQKIALDWRHEDGLPNLCGDAPQLQVALVCLLLNAEEALEGEAPGNRRIRVRLAPDGEALRLSVWNSGPVIPAEAREAVFAPFTTAKDGHHAGCGLALARHIAESHGGTLAYTPEEGFVLLLPPGEPGGE